MFGRSHPAPSVLQLRTDPAEDPRVGYTKDVAESKATAGIDAGRMEGHPLMFATEPEQ